MENSNNNVRDYDDIDKLYDKLRTKLSRWPIRLPSSPEILQILKLLYTEEEAKFLLSPAFTAPYQDRKTLSELAEDAGLRIDAVKKLADKLAARGLLMRFPDERDGNIYYSMMPFVPGIFEFYFSGDAHIEERRKIAELFDKYYRSGFVNELGASNYPWARVLPVEKTITIDKSIDPTPEILSFEKVSEYIASARKIAVMRCACRVKHPCGHPIDGSCMCFDASADFMVGRNAAKYISQEDALVLLEQMEQIGLVHITTNAQTRPQFICNCCRCSCGILHGFTQYHNPRAFAKSNFIPQQDPKLCNLCRKCVDICPLNAYTVESTQDGEEQIQITLDHLRCIGCGLCAYHCPENAIQLVKVRSQVPELKPRDAWIRVDAERIH
jgi:ferredoxin/DNA-binding MarR family transcriptional regulator